MRILTAEEMRQVDRRAIDEIGIPGMVLMENAAIGVADALAEHFPAATTVAILCGPGNNGGDGLALARLLEARGYGLRVFLVRGSKRPDGDAGTQLDILERSGLPVVDVTAETDLMAVQQSCLGVDLLVDALFGTGLSRPLDGHFAELITRMKRLPQPVLAVDLPSGLDGSRDAVPGVHWSADLTVTFAAPKIAHILPPARDAVGALVVTDLGIPSFLVPEAAGQLHLLTAEELAAHVIDTDPADHKGTYGHALVVAGSPGKSGAAVLAARAAVRGGAGLVTVAVPESLLPIVDAGSQESMTVACATASGGSLALAAAAEIVALAKDKSVVAIGPGLGQDAETVDVIRRLVTEIDRPVVLDADALNAHSRRLGDLRGRTSATVLTPHPGEMARLLSTTIVEVQADRIGAARRAADESGAVVVLKGHQSLIAAPGGDVFINPTGNPGMATGGSGDVLTGLLAALIARGYNALTAAQLAVYLHGLAGDLVGQTTAPVALAAGDLIDHLSPAWQDVFGEP